MTKNKELFAEWLVVPKNMREPKTQKELASVLNVQPETMSRWKKDQEFQDLVFEKARVRLEVELPDIMQVIVDKAKAGNFQFVKLVLELTNKHIDKITVRPEVPVIGIEQYSAAIRKVAQWEEERFGD